MCGSSDPPRRMKVLFWAILGAFSTYFAEYVGGSTMFPFSTAAGLLFVFPVYGCHAVTLSALVFRLGRPTFHTLFLGGALFGMYEAYLTKILWTSNSPEGPLLRIGGVSALDFSVLVLFWHPLMAFIVPLIVAERLLTSSSTINGLAKPGSRPWLVLAAACGANQALHSPSPIHSAAAGAIAFVVLFALGGLWIRMGGTRYTLPQLLPRGKETGAVAALLAIQYLFFTLVFRRDRIPGLRPQLTILCAYGVLTGLLLFHLRKSRTSHAPEQSTMRLPLELFGRMLAATAIASILFNLVFKGLGLANGVFLAALLSSSVAGVVLLMRTVLNLVGAPAWRVLGRNT